jgi:hypothetical protein
MGRLAAVAFVLLLGGCYQARYVNFPPQNPERAPVTWPARPVDSWRQYYLFGLTPRMQVVDARAACGGAENLHSVHTGQTALQGLLGFFSTLVVNVYSPWEASVYCWQDPRAFRAPPSR